jgi:hypothetical protein
MLKHLKIETLLEITDYRLHFKGIENATKYNVMK